ncbi:retropepsin-like aspartic protease family protein [Planktosalinus lacus]|nr:retropepsin-like aspartic protease [Planktosalinus lacus]
MESKNFQRVSLKKINSNHFELKAKVNGVKGNFILDTGASNSCIGSDSIAHFNLDVAESEVKAAGAGATNMFTQIAEGYTLDIGDWRQKKADFVVFDLQHVNEALQTANADAVNGIIGADVLKKSRAVIDYGRNCLYLKT